MAGRRLVSDAPPPLVDQPPLPPDELPPGTITTETGETRRVVSSSSSSKLTTLSDEERFSFETLLVCGQGSDELDIMGHVVTIENLDTLDDLMVAKFTEEYQGTLGQDRAWQLGTVACGIRTIDGRVIYTPLTENASPKHMFDETIKIMAKYRPVVITEIYRAICMIDVAFAELRETLVKPNG